MAQGVWPRVRARAAHPTMILAFNSICAVTWDTLQGFLTAGSKTKIYLIICAWVIHQGNAVCVRWCEAGLFRAVQYAEG